MLPERPENKDEDVVAWLLIAGKIVAGAAAIYSVWKLDSMLRGMGCRYYTVSNASVNVGKTAAFFLISSVSLPESVERVWESRYLDYLLDAALIAVFLVVALNSFEKIGQLETGGCDKYYQENFPSLNVSQAEFYSNKSTLRRDPYAVPENLSHRFNYSPQNLNPSKLKP